jgi:fatty acid desaturase
MDRRPVAYVVKSPAMLGALMAVGVPFAIVGTSWLQILIAAVLGIVLTQLAFLSHDAAHREVLRSPRADEWMALLIGTASAASAFGGGIPGIKHHQAPNRIGKDPDMAPR